MTLLLVEEHRVTVDAITYYDGRPTKNFKLCGVRDKLPGIWAYTGSISVPSTVTVRLNEQHTHESLRRVLSKEEHEKDVAALVEGNVYLVYHRSSIEGAVVQQYRSCKVVVDGKWEAFLATGSLGDGWNRWLDANRSDINNRNSLLSMTAKYLRACEIANNPVCEVTPEYDALASRIGHFECVTHEFDGEESIFTFRNAEKNAKTCLSKSEVMLALGNAKHSNGGYRQVRVVPSN